MLLRDAEFLKENAVFNDKPVDRSIDVLSIIIPASWSKVITQGWNKFTGK